MTDQVKRHAAAVNAWLDRTAGLPRAPMLDAFEEAFEALWGRAHRALGDITLTAIVDRVLATAAGAFPALGDLHVASKRRLFRDFRARAGRIPSAEVVGVIRFVLLEFLTVLGNLTAQILTPALHSELSNVAVSKPRRAAQTGDLDGPTSRPRGTLKPRQRRDRRRKVRKGDEGSRKS